jgi:hypothetical protein
MGLDWINLEGGNIRFAGSVRGVDGGGCDIFEIQAQSRPALCGEFRSRYADNQSDFDIDIVSFGFLDQRNVGNPHPDARQRFSAMERDLIERLTIALFADPKSREGIPPFTSTKGHFLGQVRFTPGWIVLNE